MMEARAQQSKDGSFALPDELTDPYLMKAMQWSWFDLQTCPAHIVDKLKLLFHLDNIVEKKRLRRANKEAKG